ncbi:hypothetical protein UACE39S_01377 [Ureibacillus acetophenoni]
MRIKSSIVFKPESSTPYSVSKPVKVLEVDLKSPGKGEVLIKIEAAGLCHSDLSVINGKRKE